MSEQPSGKPDAAPIVIRRRGRRVTTEPPAGYLGEPPTDPEPRKANENDEQLKRDVPPHWG